MEQKEIHNKKVRKINTNLEKYFSHPLDLRPVHNHCGARTLIMSTVGMTLGRQLLLCRSLLNWRGPKPGT